MQRTIWKRFVIQTSAWLKCPGKIFWPHTYIGHLFILQLKNESTANSVYEHFLYSVTQAHARKSQLRNGAKKAQGMLLAFPTTCGKDRARNIKKERAKKCCKIEYSWLGKLKAWLAVFRMYWLCFRSPGLFFHCTFSVLSLMWRRCPVQKSNRNVWT